MPGGLFDPLGMSKDETKYQEYKQKEIKNGRLAMVAFVGELIYSLRDSEIQWVVQATQATYIPFCVWWLSLKGEN